MSRTHLKHDTQNTARIIAGVKNSQGAGVPTFTDVPLVTIDGEDARDFDDAVYCEPVKRGRGKTAVSGWRLVVAIADVSHYVKPGEPLDEDAYERATSVYFPRRVIPMLPEKLSNGLCSLNPDVERLAMVCDMLIGADGEVQAYQFFPALICSHARFTYTEVAAILANTRGPEAARRSELVPHLLHLHEVYRVLLKQRVQRGAHRHLADAHRGRHGADLQPLAGQETPHGDPLPQRRVGVVLLRGGRRSGGGRSGSGHGRQPASCPSTCTSQGSTVRNSACSVCGGLAMNTLLPTAFGSA